MQSQQKEYGKENNSNSEFDYQALIKGYETSNQTQTAITTKTKQSDEKVSQQPKTEAEDYAKYFQDISNEPIDLKLYGIDENEIFQGKLEQTKITTYTTTVQNDNSKEMKIDEKISQTPTTEVINYNKDFQDFSKEPIVFKQNDKVENDLLTGNLEQTITSTNNSNTKNIQNADLKEFRKDEYISQPQSTGTEDYTKYFKDISNEPIDLKLYGIDENELFQGKLEKTKITTYSTTIQNDNSKEFKIEEAVSQPPTTKVINYNKDFEDFSKEPFALKHNDKVENGVLTRNLEQRIISANNSNIKNTQNIDLKEFRSDEYISQPPTAGTEDYTKYFQDISNEPIDLKVYGIDENELFQGKLEQTKITTYTNTIQNDNLKEFKIDENTSQPPTTGVYNYTKDFPKTSNIITTSSSTKSELTTGNGGKYFNSNQYLSNSNFSEVFGSSDINKNVKKTITTTTIQKKEEM